MEYISGRKGFQRTSASGSRHGCHASAVIRREGDYGSAGLSGFLPLLSSQTGATLLPLFRYFFTPLMSPSGDFSSGEALAIYSAPDTDGVDFDRCVRRGFITGIDGGLRDSAAARHLHPQHRQFTGFGLFKNRF